MTPDHGPSEISYIKSEKFTPVWRLALIAPFLRDKKLQTLAVLLSATSAWYAWQNYMAQKAAARPSAHITSVSISWGNAAGDFKKAKVIVGYENIGGSADRGISIRLLNPRGFGLPLLLASSDDGDRFMKTDKRSFTLDPGGDLDASKALIVCLYIDDDRSMEPTMFGFFFDKEGHTWHLSAPAMRILEELTPCLMPGI